MAMFNILQSTIKKKQRFRSISFWRGSGSLDPHLGIVDPDPDPRILVLRIVDLDPGTYFSIIFFFLFPEINNLHYNIMIYTN